MYGRIVIAQDHALAVVLIMMLIPALAAVQDAEELVTGTLGVRWLQQPAVGMIMPNTGELRQVELTLLRDTVTASRPAVT